MPFLEVLVRPGLLAGVLLGGLALTNPPIWVKAEVFAFGWALAPLLDRNLLPGLRLLARAKSE